MNFSAPAFFEPLGMKDTYFYPPESKLGQACDRIHLLFG